MAEAIRLNPCSQNLVVGLSKDHQPPTLVDGVNGQPRTPSHTRPSPPRKEREPPPLAGAFAFREVKAPEKAYGPQGFAGPLDANFATRKRHLRGTPIDKALCYNQIMFFVYVLFSLKDHRFYIGYTGNVESRVVEHVMGRVKATKNRLPLQLVYYEAYFDKRDAKGREVFLKGGSGHKYLRKQLRYFLHAHS